MCNDGASYRDFCATLGKEVDSMNPVRGLSETEQKVLSTWTPISRLSFACEWRKIRARNIVRLLSRRSFRFSENFSQRRVAN